ncbi:MAG: hypothetical protein ACRDRL_22760, partial [Sciscionella sp.]
MRIAVVVVVAAGLAGFVGLVSTPVALSGGGSFAWETAPDATVASFVTSPSTPQAWAGAGAAALSLYALAQNGYNAAAAGDVSTAIEDAAIAVGVDIDPWALVGSIAIGVAGSYIAYKAGPLYYHWLNTEWGSDGNGVLYYPSFMPVRAGQSVCIGTAVNGSPVSWTAPADGWYLNGGGNSPCSTGGGAVSWNQNSSNVRVGGVYVSTTEASVAADFGAASTDTGLELGADRKTSLIWYHEGAVRAGPPAGFDVDSVGTSTTQTTLPCSGSGYNGYGCTGMAFNNANPSTADTANALRSELSQATSSAPWTISCVISDDCPTTAVAPSFTMPNCYGLMPADCQSSLNWVGFTGTLDASTAAAAADYTQPAGVVLSTDPAAAAGGISTAASTIVEAYTNPQSCSWRLDYPHWSDNGGTVVAKGYSTCTYPTTIT